MKKIGRLLGPILMFGGFVFFLVISFVNVSSSGENLRRDLLGFVIPQPPIWTSYVPYLGLFIGYIFEMLSLHGLVALGVFIAFTSTGSYLVKLGLEKENSIQNRINLPPRNASMLSSKVRVEKLLKASKRVAE